MKGLVVLGVVLLGVLLGVVCIYSVRFYLFPSDVMLVFVGLALIVGSVVFGVVWVVWRVMRKKGGVRV